MENIDDHFTLFARRLSVGLGSAYIFFGCVIVLVIWMMVGPFLDFSLRWQITIHTIMTIFTFIGVMLRSNAANTDVKAIHAKLDALLEEHGREELINVERGQLKNHDKGPELYASEHLD